MIMEENRPDIKRLVVLAGARVPIGPGIALAPFCIRQAVDGNPPETGGYQATKEEHDDQSPVHSAVLQQNSSEDKQRQCKHASADYAQYDSGRHVIDRQRDRASPEQQRRGKCMAIPRA
jgi:hypothetical protein